MCSWRQPCSRRALDHVRVMQEQGLNNMSPQQMLANQAKYSLHTDRQLSAHCYRLCRMQRTISGDAVLSCGHQVSVAPTNLKPVKSDFTNGMSGGVESDRAKHEVQVGRVILFKDYRRQSLQLHAAFHHPNWIRA
jgi:hypothetical protein